MKWRGEKNLTTVAKVTKKEKEKNVSRFTKKIHEIRNIQREINSLYSFQPVKLQYFYSSSARKQFISYFPTYIFEFFFIPPSRNFQNIAQN